MKWLSAHGGQFLLVNGLNVATIHFFIITDFIIAEDQFLRANGGAIAEDKTSPNKKEKREKHTSNSS